RLQGPAHAGPHGGCARHRPQPARRGRRCRQSSHPAERRRAGCAQRIRRRAQGEEVRDTAMSNVGLYTASGERSGSVELPAALLAERVHTHAIWEAVKGHLANQRQGTHKTKTRHEVSGQKSKLFKQKGSGRARAGSATSGTRVGGGRIHGPRPRDHSYRVPVQVRRLALRSALASRAKKDSLFVVEDIALSAPKTKTVAALLAKMGIAD